MHIKALNKVPKTSHNSYFSKLKVHNPIKINQRNNTWFITHHYTTVYNKSVQYIKAFRKKSLEKCWSQNGKYKTVCPNHFPLNQDKKCGVLASYSNQVCVFTHNEKKGLKRNLSLITQPIMVLHRVHKHYLLSIWYHDPAESMHVQLIIYKEFSTESSIK